METEEYLRHPSEQMFYKILAYIMGLLCLNSQYWSWYSLPKNKIYRLQRILVPLCLPFSCFSQVLFLVWNYKELPFKIIAVILSIMPVALVVLCKTFTAQTKSYEIALTDLMDEIHLYNTYVRNYAENKHNFVKKTLFNAEKYTRYTFYVLVVSVSLCCVSWLIVPVVHNFQNNKSIHNITTRLELTVYHCQPFEYQFNFYGYLAQETIGIYCGAIAILIMIPFDTVNLAFVFHLIGHIQILKYDLKEAQKSKMNDKDWTAKLVDFTTYYYFITKTFKDVEAGFGLNVAAIYAQNLFQGGILIYQISTSGSDTGALLTFGLMIPIFMGMLMFLSIVLENVRIQADNIPTLVYDLPWENMSIPNRKMVLLILCQVQPTLEYTAAFNIKTGVQPALSIIKTTFSYYVMIKSSKEMSIG